MKSWILWQGLVENMRMEFSKFAMFDDSGIHLMQFAPTKRPSAMVSVGGVTGRAQ
jgi:hypothetical protein